VRLHLDPAGVKTDQRVRNRAREHASIQAARVLRVCAGTGTTSALYFQV
jgi:hypothetical protein